MIKQNLGAILRRQGKKKSKRKMTTTTLLLRYSFKQIFFLKTFKQLLRDDKLLLILLYSWMALFYSLSFIICYLFLDSLSKKKKKSLYFSIMITIYYYVNTRISFSVEEVIFVIRSRRQLVYGIEEISSLYSVYIIKLIELTGSIN